ncbi:MAG: hypothetical protein OYH77_00275 [Pseudomonadota bacterium]|nr:hypothetical protein [Pseudomonadota bacterium]
MTVRLLLLIVCAVPMPALATAECQATAESVGHVFSWLNKHMTAWQISSFYKAMNDMTNGINKSTHQNNVCAQFAAHWSRYFSNLFQTLPIEVQAKESRKFHEFMRQLQ